jgi:hypothetical protein
VIKAAGATPDGFPLVVFGLSGENVTRLMAGEPILVDLRELGLPPGRVLIAGGRTEELILTEMRGQDWLAGLLAKAGYEDHP